MDENYIPEIDIYCLAKQPYFYLLFPIYSKESTAFNSNFQNCVFAKMTWILVPPPSQPKKSGF